MVWKWVKDNIIGDFAQERRKFEAKQSEKIEEDRKRGAKGSGESGYAHEWNELRRNRCRDSQR